ncbi:hypothetical protein [Streptomyces sp. NPDC014676]|uniref:hypothetical protein n=1 Tax=Streptomyces sp. NPDC014676 TaxID=3364879 RepID=UPI003702ABC6
MLEQAVYLSASALAGIGRFVALRLVVFARNRSQDAATACTARPAPEARVAAPVDPVVLCHAA